MKICKKFVTILLMLLLSVASLAVVGCNKSTDQTKFAFDRSNFTMYVFEVESLTLRTNSNAEITWSTTNDELVSIEKDGKSANITALRTGEITIIATQGKNSTTCKVTIFPAKQNLTVEVTSALTAERLVGGTYQLTAKTYLDGTLFDGATLEYRLTQNSPEGCVTVDENGLVTMLAQGVAIVSVRAVYGNTTSNWKDVILYSFAEDYDNDSEKDPVVGGGEIDDVFGTWE